MSYRIARAFHLAPTLALAFVAFVPARAQAPAAPDTTRAVAITHVSVIPMDRERVLRDQTVLVRGARIQAVGRTGAVAIPAAARTIDGTGRFLIPGLVDAHVHYDEDDPAEDAHIDAINSEFSKLFLSAGVTTVMNLCGSAGNLALRDSIARGRVAGPSMFTSPHCLNDSTMTKSQGDSAATRAKREGYDFLKVYSFLSLAGYQGISAAARREDIPVVGHIPQRVGLQRMIDGGAAGVVHAEEFLYNAPFRLEYGDPRSSAVQLDTNRIPEVAHAVHAAGMAVTPTLVAYSSIIDEAVSLDSVLARPEMRRVSDVVKKTRGWYAADNDRARRLGAPMPLARLRLGLEMQKRLVRAFRDSGVVLLAGTDAGGSIPMVPGWSLHDELQLLVSAGLTPYEALRAATANAGEFFTRRFHAPPSGTITRGARADMMLLDANPLEDIRNTRRIRGVMVRGRWMPSSSN
jgi:imidazolonepropionase-like amidohydrolase